VAKLCRSVWGPTRFAMAARRAAAARAFRGPTLLPFTAPHRDLSAIEINVLHPEFQTFLQPQARSVQQHPDDPHRPVQAREDRRHLLAAEHDGKPKRRLGSDDVLDRAYLNLEDALVQKEKRRKRLILR